MGNTISKKCSIFLIGSSLFFQGCFAYGNKSKVYLETETKTQSQPLPALNSTLASVDVSNDTVSINGTNLLDVTAVKIKGHGIDTNLSISSQSNTQISAVATQAISLLVGGVFELILSSASAQSSYPVTFTLDPMGATPGQILKFNNGSWGPEDLTAGVSTLNVSSAAATPLLVESTGGTFSGIEFKNLGSSGPAESIMSSNDTILIQTGGLNRVYIGSNFGVGSAAPIGVPFYVKNTSLVARFENNSVGSSAMANSMNGVEFVTGNMNLTAKYGQGIKFMSTDDEFTTEPVKFLSGIFPRATEGYTADNRGGSALDFLISPNTPGVNNVPITAMTVDQSGYVGIGIETPTQKLHVIGNILASGTITANSDRRLKKKITPIRDALTKLENITGVQYFWIRPELHNEGEQIGVIAQDVEKVFPQAVITGVDGIKSVSYMGLVAPVIQAIKELNSKSKSMIANTLDQDSRIKKLEKENNELKLRLTRIENALSK